MKLSDPTIEPKASFAAEHSKRPLGSGGDSSRAFVILDGLRGLAAFTVIVFHAPEMFGRFSFPSGYLAVDFFFMLSGFVLTFAYQAKLDAGWSTVAFFKTRIARLYPLYLLGLLLGFLFTVFVNVYRGLPVINNYRLLALGLGLLILPMESRHPFSGNTAFPMNFPSWSIFFELIANVIHARFLRHRTTVILSFVALFSFGGVLFYAQMIGTINVGLDSPENVFCIFRVMFSYTVGMLLFRVWKSGVVKIKVPPTLIALVLLVSLALPITKIRVLHELSIMIIVFPAVILAASVAQPNPRWVQLFRILGQASYALYILHGPLYSLFVQSWIHVSRRAFEDFAPWNSLIFLTFLTAAALLLDRFYDAPTRAFLRRKLVDQ